MKLSDDIEIAPTKIDHDQNGLQRETYIPAAKPKKLERGLITTTASEVVSVPVTWLWPKRLAIGKLNLIAGEPGLGKSQLSIFLAASVSQGDKWPDGAGRAPQGGVLIINIEDDIADTIKPRLEACGAAMSHIHFSSMVNGAKDVQRTFSITDDIDALRQFVIQYSIKLVILDPIMALMGSKNAGGGALDTHKNSDVRASLAPLSLLAQELGFCLIGITHFAKNMGDGNAMNAVVGSGAFVQSARAAWAIAKDPNDDSGTKRLFLPLKNNLGFVRGLRFVVSSITLPSGIATSRIEFERGEIMMTAEEVHSIKAKHKGQAGLRAIDEAGEFLKESLSLGAMPATELQEMAEAQGHVWKTVCRAAQKNKIKPFKQGFGAEGKWIWPEYTKDQGHLEFDG